MAPTACCAAAATAASRSLVVDQLDLTPRQQRREPRACLAEEHDDAGNARDHVARLLEKRDLGRSRMHGSAAGVG